MESLKLKINSGLPLNDVRSERAMREGGRIVQMIADGPWAGLVSVLCLHFVPIEMDELWMVVKRMTCLKKLSVSNCEVSQSNWDISVAGVSLFSYGYVSVDQCAFQRARRQSFVLG